MDSIIAVADRAIAERAFPGCVIGVVQGGVSDVFVRGQYSYEADSEVVTEQSVYDLASVTKVIPTAALAFNLIDKGTLQLDDRLITYIPEYATKQREAVTIRHLLTYTLGNTVPLSRSGTTPEDIFKAVCSEETLPPGTVFNYSNTPAYLLGLVIERLSGSLDRAAQIALFEPLGMKNATFAPHGAVPSEEGIQDTVHDESARIFARAGKAVGHAGLFSDVGDLLAFLKHLLAHPDARISTNLLASLGASAGLGWELDQPWMGRNRSSETFGKTGFTGTCVVGNFVRKIGLVILSNRTYPTRPENREAIDRFRAAVCDIVFA